MPNEPLTNSERGHYEETITRLSGASQLQKFLVWLIFLIATIGLVITIKASTDASKRATDQNAKGNQIIQQQDKFLESQVAIVNRHIDCVIAFFTYQDRNTLTIKDIDNCTFDREGEILQPDTTSPQSMPLTPSRTPSSSSQPKSSGSTSSGSNPPTGTTPSVNATPNCKVDLLFIHLGC